MDQDNDIDYYRRREAVARRLAATAKDPSIATLHAHMADIYAAKVSQDAPRPVLTLVR